MIITGEVLGGGEVAARIQGVGLSIRAELKKAVLSQSIELQRYISKNKLNGQVLNRRTGTLARSIHSEALESGHEVSGRVFTNLKYARAHEYGCTDTVSVKEHLRMQTMAWGKLMLNPHQVVVMEHSMKMNLKERSYMRSSLVEKNSEILSALEIAVAQGVKS